MFAAKPAGMPVEPIARVILPPPSAVYSTLTITSSLVFAVGAALTGLTSLALSTFLDAVTIYVTTLYATTIGSATSLVSAIYATAGFYQILQTLDFKCTYLTLGSTGYWRTDSGASTTTLRADYANLSGLTPVTGAASYIGTTSYPYTSGKFTNLNSSTFTTTTVAAASVAVSGALTVGGTSSLQNVNAADVSATNVSASSSVSAPAGFFTTIRAPSTLQAVWLGNTATNVTESGAFTTVSGALNPGYLTALSTNTISFTGTPSANSTWTFADAGLYSITINVAVNTPMTNIPFWRMAYTGRTDGLTVLYMGLLPSSCIGGHFTYTTLVRFQAGGSFQFQIGVNSPFAYTFYYGSQSTYVIINRIL